VRDLAIDRRLGLLQQRGQTLDGQLLRAGLRRHIDVRGHCFLETLARTEREDDGDEGG
jgi:hypothetical protein